MQGQRICVIKCHISRINGRERLSRSSSAQCPAKHLIVQSRAANKSRALNRLSPGSLTKPSRTKLFEKDRLIWACLAYADMALLEWGPHPGFAILKKFPSRCQCCYLSILIPHPLCLASTVYFELSFYV